MNNFSIIFLLSITILGVSCKKSNNNITPKDAVICYTFDEGFTGRIHHTLLAVNEMDMKQHELHQSCRKVLISKSAMKEILNTLEKEDFKNIGFNTLPTSDRGGITIELRYGNGNVRLIKSDANDSFIKETDKPRFQRCKEVIEKYIPKKDDKIPAEER
jgi:hypothetical protein